MIGTSTNISRLNFIQPYSSTLVVSCSRLLYSPHFRSKVYLFTIGIENISLLVTLNAPFPSVSFTAVIIIVTIEELRYTCTTIPWIKRDSENILADSREPFTKMVGTMTCILIIIHQLKDVFFATCYREWLSVIFCQSINAAIYHFIYLLNS